MSSKKFYKYLCLIIFLLLVSVGIGFYLLFFPPRDEKDTLQMLRLNTGTLPLFQLESQVTYTPDLYAKLQSTILSEPSHNSTLQELNIGIHLEEGSPLEQVSAEITALSARIPHITISLLPDQQMNSESYIASFTRLNKLLENTGSSSIEIILYPKSTWDLSTYATLDHVKSIGIAIDYPLDLSSVTAIYEQFKGSKTIYIRENMINSDAALNDIIKDINLLYYTLAIDYPQCQTIFSPFMKLPFEVSDPYSLSTTHLDFGTYQTIYGRLLGEPWLTIEETVLSNKSPYELVNSYDVLSDGEELMLSPKSSLINSPSDNSDNHSTAKYLHYRIDGKPLTIQNYYPYLMQLDTTAYPNGITRIKAITADGEGQVLDVQSIDLVIHNENTHLRTERYLGESSFTSAPRYGSSYIPILMYHSIADEVAVEDNNHTVQTELFDQQMKALVDHGYTPINFKMLQDYLEGANGLPEKPILITMDDGYLNNYTHAYPVYKKYNISATLFVSAYYMEEENTDRHFGWSAAKEMEDSGLIDIQSHGYNHTPLPYLSVKDLKYHLSKSKELIEKHLGARDVFVVAYPQFRNTFYTRELLSDLGVDFQITNLAKVGTGLNTSDLKRINVPNTMSPEELIATIEELTR